ncbi:hypothetical protein NW768_004321 [Fusarium equiseti]|uniref:Uncharacterized protein n=1 Tax=Fusarium equiseti TaxID=61235 RepID=A0ABQ8RG41_FUSEQ|nr:hypothetical protein NW768_004321 [Fusarium equiseti]
MDLALPFKVERRNSSASSIVAVHSGHSQDEFKPENIREETDTDGEDESYDGPPKKKARRPPVPADPCEEPCLKCASKMADEGPESLCHHQGSPTAVNCYECARHRRTCPKLPPHAVGPGRRLQEAAIRIANGHPVNNWHQLSVQFKTVMQQSETLQAVARRESLRQTNTEPTTQRENTSQDSPIINAQAPPAHTIPPSGSHSAQLSQEIQVLKGVLQQTREDQRIQDRHSQQSLEIQESGFTAVTAAIKELTHLVRQLGVATNLQTDELRLMRADMRRVNGSHEENMPSFALPPPPPLVEVTDVHVGLAKLFEV